MNILTAISFCLILTLSSVSMALGQWKSILPSELNSSPALQTILENAVNDAIKNALPSVIKTDQIAATVIDLSDPVQMKIATVSGDVKMYPASVVKLFYMVALHQWLENGKIKSTPELERGLQDMIEVSSNDATHYIFDVLTETSAGAELAPKALKSYAFKKNVVNRYFGSLGYDEINVNQKTYCEDIYGRERQFWDTGKQRNKLTTNATARLMAEIALGRAVSVQRSQQMLELMKRDPFKPTSDKEDQAHGFTGISLIEMDLKDARIWSKAGYTSSTRHDAAYIEIPLGPKFVIVIFTLDHANERRIIPEIATPVVRYFLEKRMAS